MKNLLCPKCNKLARSPHFSTCFLGFPKDEVNLQCLLFTWPNLHEAKSTLEKQQSVNSAAKVLNVPYSRLTQFAKLTNLKLPSMKEASSSQAVRNRVKETCRINFGADNPLSRGTVAFEKRNKTVRDKYGVDNVFQLNHVKEQITSTILELYGVKRKTNALKIKMSKMALTPDQRREIGRKISEYKRQNPPKRHGEKAFNWKMLSTPNKLESKVFSALSELGIDFQFSFWISGRQFDFRLNNILLEVQGDYWHANPKFYTSCQELSFPGNKKIKAEELWEKDYRKKILAESRGYNVIYLWENDIRNCANLEEFISHQLERFHLTA